MEENKIDTNLYSRQIGTFGMETMGKLIQMKVLIHGLRGLGVEIAKNIILAGPNSVTLHDPEIVSVNDLGSNFYLSESDVGKSQRDQASLTKLSELNPYVKTSTLSGSLSENLEKLKDYHVVVITEVINSELAAKIDEVCRSNKHGFIYTAALGVTGYAFVDYGQDFMIRDENGEECKQYIVRTVSKEKTGVVLIDDTIGKGKIEFIDGDYVVFREVQGMKQLNDNVPREIKWISPMAFSIGDTSSYDDYTSGGIVEQVKVPKPHNYKSFKDSVANPYNGKVNDPIDFAKFGRNEQLHLAFRALFEWFDKNNGLPKLNDEAVAEEVNQSAKATYDSGKTNNVEWVNNSGDYNDSIAKRVSRWSRSQLVPITAFLGGVVAQEIVKFTGKYTPINQWLWFDFFETVDNLKEVNREPLGSRYDDQIAVFGRELQEQLQNQNLFMIGAGALGCEFIKNFALMGISTKNGKTVVTDNDNIEISNLNRQFLFRKTDVGKSKSERACAAVSHMNSQFRKETLQARVGPENEHIFDDKFWDSQNFIINAVDNVKARRYIDSQCTWHTKTLIDSGTLGTKAHVQMIVPHVTSCYNDTQDPPEESIPMCTLHNFPSMIEHCIEWGRDHFNGYFTDVVKDAHELLNDPSKYFTDLKKEGNSTFQLEKLQSVQKLITIMKSGEFFGCVEFAVEKFTENFDHKIKQLLHNFPADYTNPDGSKFWTGSKRTPHPIVYDPKDEYSRDFVVTYASLIAQACGITVPSSKEEIAAMSGKVPIREFAPKKVYIKVNDSDTGGELNLGQEEDEKLRVLMASLDIADKTAASKLKPHEFEKDDDNNGHIDFINACSNLRARNYKITECDRQKTKMIAGKIIPAIATTTAAITGLVCLQLYTLLQTNNITYMRNAFINLAVSLFVLTEPGEKIEVKDNPYDKLLLGPVKAVPPKWTVWDRIEITGSKTVKEVIAFFQQQYQVDVSIITSNGATIIQTFMPAHKARLDLKVEDLYVKNSKYPLKENSNYLVLEISADTSDGAAALMPLVKYIFK